jgi:tetratricopeptide (TPR) repeat protein
MSPAVARDTAPAAQPFVGRQGQFRELTSAAARAASGRGGLLLLTGEAGIGKTRLSTEVAARCERDGMGVLWAACWEGEGAPAFWPWIQVVRTHVRRREPDALRHELGVGAGEIARLVPEVLERFPDLPVPPDEGAQARFRVYDGVSGFLHRLAAARPHLVVLDDLQWADEPSLQLLRFLATDLRDSGLLVLGTFRDLEVGSGHPLPRLLGEIPGGAHLVRLDGLSHDEVGDLIASLGGEPPDAELVASVHGRTAGNPFFVREVLRLLQKGPERAGDVPSGVRAVVGRRLRQLSRACHEVLEAAAIIGPEFSLAVLADVADLPPARLLALLEEALGARLIEEMDTAGGHRFSHALVREVLASQVAPDVRRQLHRRIGTALARLHGGMGDGLEGELARHFRAAGGAADLARALDFEERAAARSSRMHAHGDAAAHLRRALELVGLVDHANRTRRCALLLALGEAQRAAGEIAASRRTLERAAEAARELEEPSLLARAALGLGTEFAAGGTDDLEVSLLEEALRGAADPALRALLLARLARALLFSPLYGRRAELAEEATRIARRLDDPAILASVLYDRHQALSGLDPPEERLRMTDEIVELSERAGDLTLALEARALRIGDLFELGRTDRVQTELDVYARLLHERNMVAFQWHVPLQRAHLAAQAGRFEEAEELSAQMLALGGRVQHQGIEVFHSTVRSTIPFLQGRLGELVDVIREGARAHPGLLPYRAGLTLALSEAGREEEARAEFELVAAAGFRDIPRDILWQPSLALLAVTCCYLGDARRAELLYERMLPHRPGNVLLSRIGGTMGATEHYLGMLAATMGRWADAVAHLQAAVEAHARQGFPPLLANSRFQLAGALTGRRGPGDGERAAAEMQAARRMAGALGIRLILEERAGARPPAGAASLRQEGELWTLSYEGRQTHLRDAVGIGLLARLLREPNREFHVLDLSTPRGRTPHPVADAGPVLDERAKTQYRQRLRDLAEEIEEAEAWGDVERATRARREVDLLTEQLVRAVGLGGRDRKTGSDAERARANVTKALRTAIKRIGEQEADLGAHLAVGVRTGTFCAYSPDPASAITWTV